MLCGYEIICTMLMYTVNNVALAFVGIQFISHVIAIQLYVDGIKCDMQYSLHFCMEWTIM